MEVLWFWLAGFLVAGYVLLDGYDLGAGMAHLFIARGDGEKRQTLAAIAPFWDANEVWLIAAGGTLFFAFPSAYAASFSGFYLPLIVVLWLLMVRGISIEFRNHSNSPTWAPVWDAGFSLSSLTLALFYGVALANVIRGVPLDQNAEFFLPLWTDFGHAGELGILDWYTVPVGVFATTALCLHGTVWVAYKVEGELQRRCRKVALRLAPLAGAIGVLVTILTFRVQPQASANVAAAPLGLIFPILAAMGLCACFGYLVCGNDRNAFFGSSLFLVGMLGSAAFTLFPYVLPSSASRDLGLTVYNSNPGSYGMKIGLLWWIPGMVLAVGYSIFAHRHFSAKVAVQR